MKKLSDEILAALNDVPWKEPRGLCNVIVHEYGEVEWDVLYDTVMEDFPHVIEAIDGFCRANSLR